jgi:dUTP pyrophosphatase
MLVPRSSIAKTPFIMIGIIDPNYRGELMVALRSFEPNTVLSQGTRLFQIVAFDGQPIQTYVVDSLSTTNRGAAGFGSTGSN